MEEVDVFVPLGADEPLPRLAARALALAPVHVGEVTVLRRALDARKGRPLGYRLRLGVRRPDEPAPAVRIQRPALSLAAGVRSPRVVIVGAGPAGTWAALRLVEAGCSEITILEQGKPVQPRRHDLAALQRGRLEPSSNYCFGEGGAGTYSDGKLYTRSKDRAGVAAVLGDLAQFGAPADIQVEARAHVGSNRLPKVLTALRAHLEAAGVRYVFEAALTDIDVAHGRVRGVRAANGLELAADAVVLAVGHSARPVYEWVARKGLPIERKSFALGVRLEHPQRVIDRMQYGPAAEDPRLPAAFYEIKTQARGRGVYSFCMCPGGFIVPAATEPEGLVVNGMSLSRRDSPFANSGLVVSVSADELGGAGDGPLAGMKLQRQIEEAAFRAGGGDFVAPAQRLVDVLANRPSSSLPGTSYHRGIRAADLGAVFPPPLWAALREGLAKLAHDLPALRVPDAVLVGAETRTSAPVRLPRDPITFEMPHVRGLFPAGEGAGYAGGIVSAALDGVRVAEAIVARAHAGP